MSKKQKMAAVVLSQEKIAEDIYSMWLKAEPIAAEAVPGQFISMYTNDGGKLLPRPISLCEIDQENGALRVVYRVTGKQTGTEQFSLMKEGDTLDVMGPLGNGFDLETGREQKAMLIGGGIGVPPMLELAKQLKAGYQTECQLVMGYRSETFLTKELEENGTLGGKLLPRPISLCEIDQENGALRVVYRVTGKQTGTEQFSLMKEEDTLDVMGPLGNGFDLETGREKKAMLFGGGIGVPPMLELAKQLKAGYQTECQLVMGYRSETFLTKELEENGTLYIATEDGSTGTKGNVMDAVAANSLEADVIYACGPTPMLRAIKQYAQERNIECYISMEERMACGVGACLGCVCQSKEVDHHSHVHNKRVCKDGPVFLATEVEL